MDVSRKDFLAGAAGTAAVAATVSVQSVADAAAPADLSNATYTMLRDGSVDHIGVRGKHGIIDVDRVAKASGVTGGYAATIDELLQRGPGSLASLLAAVPPGAIREEGSVQFAPLVSTPEKILCVGLNYQAHLNETGMKTPDFPDLFNKYNTSLNRHNGTVNVSALPLKNFDYESELVVYIGKEARNVSEADALNCVFGYSCGNDFSARDAQLRVSQWMTGKTPDEFAPLGPWLVPAGVVGDPQQLQIQTFVNDETTPRQDMNTAQMIFNCRKIVSYMSEFITLRPGDIIFTGTPSGVILGYPEAKRIWLKPGDRITTKISKLGELKFTLT
jgi:2-keto-4-pentenoate hydratase/2-oxohepta-3-ene-1,7-dioic acid hydratase in catechol pathway